MSRCFSYPPPGYSGNEGSGQALIESIKLQRERELAIQETKKERKREKKERRKEKKGKSKSSLLPEKKIHKSSSSGLKSKSLQQLLLSENEQLERSSLTEEHAQPAGELKPSTSSDSTQNSSKRKREASPPAGVKQEENSLRSNGNVIRIRLSSQKQNHLVNRQESCSTSSERTVSPLQQQDAVISRQEPCSTSGRTELHTSKKYQSQVDVSSFQQRNNNVFRVGPPEPETQVVSTSVPISVTREDETAVISQLPNGLLPPRPDSKDCSTLGGPKPTAPEDDIPVRDPKSLSKKLVKAEFRYRDLFSNWVPPPLMELESDEDWLFSKKKNPDTQIEKVLKPSNVVSCGSNSSLWPRAQFIPEADIYALPFTVPF